MPFTKFTNLDFDQIRTSIKDYLRANSTFTDFDFEGSNFSTLIDTLAYNTYITAFNSNMIVNESFLDSATLRENVISLARNIGYIPRSRTAATAEVSFDISISGDTQTATLEAGLVCIGRDDDTTYTFATPENISTTVSGGVASFTNVKVFQGTFLRRTFTVDASINQKFILDNSYVDTSTIRVYVKGPQETGTGLEYTLVDNIININSESRIFLIQEIQDEKYELLFGDGFIGKKLENESTITVEYIVTDGIDGNGPSIFSFAGSIIDDQSKSVLNPGNPTVTTSLAAQSGSNAETLDSIKYYAPRIYSAQYRAVTARDYEAIIKQIYPETESVSVIGGEELDPPEFGSVTISIKPKNGSFVSDFSKNQILSKLKQYGVSGINQKIIDLKILYVEIDSSVYYDFSKTSKVDDLKTKIINSLNSYSKSIDLNKFGGRFKYSKLLQVIDNTDTAITSNITKIRIRRDLKAAINQSAQYELCFGNRFHIDEDGFNIKSTGFKISGETDTVYLTDIPNDDKKTGIISIVKPLQETGTNRVIVKNAGIVDYEKGEVILQTILITSTSLPDNIIEIQAIPESNDVVGLKDLYLSLSVSKSTINMVRDVIASGDEISGTVFVRDFYTSSYSNGKLIRE
tara:strand:- start:1436 stop:3331 length:1896 start_codon:yes stop_codon:yes gene_type:complete